MFKYTRTLKSFFQSIFYNLKLNKSPSIHHTNLTGLNNNDYMKDYYHLRLLI